MPEQLIPVLALIQPALAFVFRAEGFGPHVRVPHVDEDTAVVVWVGVAEDLQGFGHAERAGAGEA